MGTYKSKDSEGSNCVAADVHFVLEPSLCHDAADQRFRTE
jgi:hypothetical protein